MNKRFVQQANSMSDFFFVSKPFIMNSANTPTKNTHKNDAINIQY